MQVSPHHRAKSCHRTWATQEHTAKMYGEWDTALPGPTPTSHSARLRSPQWGIPLFSRNTQYPHHHLHSSQFTPPCPFDGCAIASAAQQQHSEAVQYPGGWMPPPWGRSVTQLQHEVEHSTPTVPGEQACQYSFLDLLIFLMHSVAQGLIYHPCYPLH